MRCLPALFTCLLWSQLCNGQPVVTAPHPGIYAGGGSVILTIVDKDSIVLMADSRQSFDNKKPSTSVNKINTYEGIFYAQAGTSVMMRGGEKILDLNDTLGSIIKTVKFKNIPRAYKNSLNAIVKTYVDKYHVPLHAFTNHDDKDSFLCKISVVTYKKKKPKYIFGSFLLSVTPKGFKIRFVEDYKPPAYPFINKSGNLTVMQDFLAKNPAYFNATGGLPDKCVYMVKLTAKALPGEVGCPIKMVVIKPGSYRWLPAIDDCSF